MAIVWLITLVFYGASTGWQIDPLFWWLLLPLAGQDIWDMQNKRSR